MATFFDENFSFCCTRFFFFFFLFDVFLDEPEHPNAVVFASFDRKPLEHQLLEASKSGDLDLVKKLVSTENGKDLIHCRDLDGRHSTALHFAAGYNRIEVVKYLIDNGSDIQAKDKGGLVPLHNACSYGHYEVTELLVQV